MATQNGALSPVWDDFDRWAPPPVRRHIGPAADHVYNYRQLGQLFMMGFDGTSVNPQIRALIEDHRVGSVLLTAKNLKCAFDIPDH
jgi:hypothetical protein